MSNLEKKIKNCVLGGAFLGCMFLLVKTEAEELPNFRSELLTPTQNVMSYYSIVQELPQDKLIEYCSKMVMRTSYACAYYSSDSNTCYKFIPKIINMDETKKFEVLGHEDLHCMKGTYHK